MRSIFREQKALPENGLPQSERLPVSFGAFAMLCEQSPKGILCMQDFFGQFEYRRHTLAPPLGLFQVRLARKMLMPLWACTKNAGPFARPFQVCSLSPLAHRLLQVSAFRFFSFPLFSTPCPRSPHVAFAAIPASCRYSRWASRF